MGLGWALDSPNPINMGGKYSDDHDSDQIDIKKFRSCFYFTNFYFSIFFQETNNVNVWD
uniref:Uncharacterized protein n=1 Tax=Rhizophagus irregularis (strain DAOM 181602 / DAOM 197198 / MUCL 43194) TaxID=747089 RepID=U9U270_RHIID